MEWKNTVVINVWIYKHWKRTSARNTFTLQLRSSSTRHNRCELLCFRTDSRFILYQRTEKKQEAQQTCLISKQSVPVHYINRNIVLLWLPFRTLKPRSMILICFRANESDEARKALYLSTLHSTELNVWSNWKLSFNAPNKFTYTWRYVHFIPTSSSSNVVPAGRIR